MTPQNRARMSDEVDIAKMQIELNQEQLKENLEDINKILFKMKQTRKIKSCLIYLKLNCLDDNHNEVQLKLAEKRYKDFSHLYDIAILKRKLLKNEFKQAQRKFAKKLKRIKDFNIKHFSDNV